MFCPNCGKPAADGDAFCSVCGAALKAAETSAPADGQAASCETQAPLQAQEAQMPPAAEQIPGADAAEQAPACEAAEDSADGVQPDAPMLEADQPPMPDSAVSAPAVEAVQPEEDVPPEAPKKRHVGLIIGIITAVVILGGILLAGLLTDWFGLAADPCKEIAEAFSNTFASDSLTMDVYMDTGSTKMSGTLTVAQDVQKHEFAFLLDGQIEDSGFTLDMTMGLSGDKMVIGLAGQYYSIDVQEEVDAYWDAAASQDDDEQEDVDWEDILDLMEKELKSQLDSETLAEIYEHVDFEALDDCLEAYGECYRDADWLENYAGYSKSKENGETIYRFNPQLQRFLKESLRMFRSAFVQPEEYDELMDELKSGGDDFDGTDICISFGVKDRLLTSIAMEVTVDGEKMELEYSFRDCNKTRVDTNLIEKIINQATEIDMSDFF